METTTKGRIVKFIVKKSALNEVDVTLHWKTKSKLKRMAWLGYSVVVGVFALSLYNKKKNELEEPTES